MATKIIASHGGSSASTSTPQRLQIGSNNRHDIVFENDGYVADFAAKHACRIAGLLRVLQGFEGEPMYGEEVLDLTADLAWELEQATTLLASLLAGAQHG
ncbi:MAG: hypothetical protein EOP76_09580 [Variovorax sp.]|nr:MAG: hypothetical protein EOP76_09580 [Variovorax sp.]